MKAFDRPGSAQATTPRSPAARTLRNGRLLATSALQHLMDDPALLAIQVSRRLPFGPRVAVGRALEGIGAVFPAVGALGSVMAGRVEKAEKAVVASNAGARRSPSRLAGEVAILLDRVDLVPGDAPASTRARAAWSRGEMSAALQILEESGDSGSRYARRLRSERQLLQPGFRLPVPPRRLDTSPVREEEPLRVLHLLTNSLPHTQSGYSLRTHRILTALREQGVDSVALTRTGYPVMVGIPFADDEDVVDGIRYVRTLPSHLPQTQQARLEAEAAQALDLVEEFRPHVLHATTNFQNALVAQAVADATGLPWIFEVRGLMEKTWVASRRSEEGRKQAERSEKHDLIVRKEGEQAREANAVVTLSRTMSDELTARGVDDSTITLVPNGVDDSLFQDQVGPAGAREMVGLEDLPGFGAEAILVGAVSALVDYEGFDTLLRAVAEIVNDDAASAGLRARLRVVIAGDGAARPGLLALAEELGIADRVHLPGRVPRDEARRWVESLDVVVVARSDVDVARAVTPQKPVEAMALGRALIVSDLPALREVIITPDGTHAGTLVRPDDPHDLARAIREVVGTDRPGALVAAAELARARSWPHLMRRYVELYTRVTGRTEGGDVGGD